LKVRRAPAAEPPCLTRPHPSPLAPRRTNTIGAVARIRNALAFATHTFFQSRGFYYVHTPIITASDCEGAGEMFSVRTRRVPGRGRAAGRHSRRRAGGRLRQRHCSVSAPRRALTRRRTFLDPHLR
jgi:hypothetical protein